MSFVDSFAIRHACQIYFLASFEADNGRVFIPEYGIRHNPIILKFAFVVYTAFASMFGITDSSVFPAAVAYF